MSKELMDDLADFLGWNFMESSRIEVYRDGSFYVYGIGQWNVVIASGVFPDCL